MTIVWRVLEYLWFPLVITTAVWTAMKLGPVDDETKLAVGGFAIIAFMLYRLYRHAMSFGTFWRVYFALSVAWYVAVVACYLATGPPDAPKEAIDRLTTIGTTPLFIGLYFARARVTDGT